MSNYKILFSPTKNLYVEECPVIIKSGALVVNTENERLHIQLKFKNITSNTIISLKAKIILMDSVGREIDETEKIYPDLNAKLNDEFGAKTPIPINNGIVRKFSATVTEVCFADGSIWYPSPTSTWEEIPTPRPLYEQFTSTESQAEFRYLHGKNAQFIPLSYKDLWICTCGNENKNNHLRCTKCNANLSAMESAEEETLRKDNIYKNAVALASKNNSAHHKKSIALFERINDWKDSIEKIEEVRKKLFFVTKEEEKKREEEETKRKDNMFLTSITLVAVAVATVIIIIAASISSCTKKNATTNKYEQTIQCYKHN